MSVQREDIYCKEGRVEKTHKTRAPKSDDSGSGSDGRQQSSITSSQHQQSTGKKRCRQISTQDEHIG